MCKVLLLVTSSGIAETLFFTLLQFFFFLFSWHNTVLFLRWNYKEDRAMVKKLRSDLQI